MNPASARKANEDHIIKQNIYLPIRYYNFLYAKYECGGDIEKAIEYAKAHLFDLGNQPVYLPDILEQKMNQQMSYTKIMEMIAEREKTLT